jgi:hypothetical protein
MSTTYLHVVSMLRMGGAIHLLPLYTYILPFRMFSSLTIGQDKQAQRSWFQASAAMLMKSVVFWVITWRRVVIIRVGILTCEDGTDTLSRNVGK